MERSLEYKVSSSTNVNIPGSASGNSNGVVSTFITPDSRRDVSNSDSPSSFHTADQIDYDYQQDVKSEILESPSSSPPNKSRFYSDGRPRPHYDGDDESKDSFEEGGYVTATQIPPAQKFVYSDQPKLLLADEVIPPLEEKRHLPNGLEQYLVANPQDPNNHGHEALHRNHKSHRQQNRSKSHAKENTPLLPPQNQENKETSNCCNLL